MVMGLYLVVWGKAKEQKNLIPPCPEKEISQQLPVIAPKIENNENKAQVVINGAGTNDVEARGSSSTESN